MTPTASDQPGKEASCAASFLRQSHWWLSAFVVSLGVAIYFDPVTLGYVCYSVGFGFVWFALTLVTWRRRSSVLSVFTAFTIFQAHYAFRVLQPPYRPSVTGILISGAVLFCILLVGRSRIGRYCGLHR
jgi:hypothetical protein